MIKPITPNEVAKGKMEFPEEVIEAFNELIAKDFCIDHAIIMEDDVARLIKKKFNANGKKVTMDEIYDNGWLDVETVFRKAGWKVTYDKPGYNETYDASFEFKK